MPGERVISESGTLPLDCIGSHWIGSDFWQWLQKCLVLVLLVANRIPCFKIVLLTDWFASRVCLFVLVVFSGCRISLRVDRFLGLRFRFWFRFWFLFDFFLVIAGNIVGKRFVEHDLVENVNLYGRSREKRTQESASVSRSIDPSVSSSCYKYYY